MNLLLLCSLTWLGVAIARPAQAQNQPSGTPAATSPTAVGAVKQHGRMMAMKAGQMTPMTQDMPLANGTTLHPDGTLRLPSGQQMPLSEGEKVRMNGIVVPAPHPAAQRVTRFNRHTEAGTRPPTP